MRLVVMCNCLTFFPKRFQTSPQHRWLPHAHTPSNHQQQERLCALPFPSL